MEPTEVKYLIVRSGSKASYLLAFAGRELEWTSDRSKAARHGLQSAQEVVSRLSDVDGLQDVRFERY